MLLPTIALTLLLTFWSVDAKDHRELAKRTTFTKYYTSIVAFGASYQDNAHARANQYKQYQRGWPYSGGRFTNGPVMSEYLAKSLRLPLMDYAYGGAVVVNDDWVSAGVPDVSSQVTQYLSDVKGAKLNRGKGRNLNVFWAGINDVIGIWNSWRSGSDLNAATAQVIAHANRLVAEAKRIQSGATSGVFNVDLLLLPLPPLEIVPNLIAASGGNTAQLAQLKKFVTAYNTALNSGIQTLTKSGGSKSRVLTYNVPKWWYAAISKPSSIGVKDVKDACFNSSNNQVCPNPKEYFYFDTLHPTTTTFQSLAKAVLKVI